MKVKQLAPLAILVLLLATACGKESAPVFDADLLTSSGRAKLVLNVGKSGEFDSCQAKYPFIVGDRMYYNGRSNNCAPGAIGFAERTSDGSWEKRGKVFPSHGEKFAADHPTILFENGIYRMWYTHGVDYRRAVGYAESTDGIDWTSFGIVLDGFHPAVVRDGSKIVLYVNRPKGSVIALWKTESLDNGATWAPLEQVANPTGRGYIYNAFALSTSEVWYSRHVIETNQVCIMKMGQTEPVLCNGFEGVLDRYAAFAPFVDGQDFYYSASPMRTNGYVVLKVSEQQ